MSDVTVIDFATRQPFVPAANADERPAPGKEAMDQLRVSEVREGYEACRHRSYQIDNKQRTVKCGTCGIWLDPVWCINEMFYYYDRRIDDRLASIKEFDERQAEKHKRRDAKGPKRRVQRMETRDAELERAAYNEYQSKLLALRAQRQRTRAAKIEAELEAANG